MNSRKYLLTLFTVAILVLLVGAFFYYIMSKQKNTPNQIFTNFINSTAYQDILKMHDAGDLDDAIKGFIDLENTAPSKGASIQAQLKVAYDLFFRNQGDDRSRSAQLYKQIITDQSAYSLQRVLAISDLMDNSILDKKFARTVAFKGEPFEKFLIEAISLGYDKNDSDIAYATRRAYETAEEIYPLSLVEFRIATWYLTELNNNTAKNDTARRTELVSELKWWTIMGESNLEASLQLDYEKSKLGYIYEMNGISRWGLAKHSGDLNSYELAESSFKEGLRVLTPEGSMVHTFDLGMNLRFYYAAMLAEVYGENRVSDIKSLLQPIISGPPPDFKNYPFGFFNFLKNNQSSQVHIARLIKFVPEFKQFLEMRGISYP